MTEFRSPTRPAGEAAPRTRPGATLRGLLIDWGGVLTTVLPDAMSAWAGHDGVDYEHFRGLMRRWLGRGSDRVPETNPIHALERGEMDGPQFERNLVEWLRTHDGRPVPAEGLLERMFGGFRTAAAMHDAVRMAKAAGIGTCLLSNSWGRTYRRDDWDELFDTVVISGEVGMRKPEERIFRLAVDRLGAPPRECVFVDDLRPNVRAAVEIGMVGVHHVTEGQTLDELETLFDVPLRAS